jgi:hypothetical protein
VSIVVSFTPPEASSIIRDVLVELRIQLHDLREALMACRRNPDSLRPPLLSWAAALLLSLAASSGFPVHAASVSKKFVLEQNRPMSLELSVAQVTAEQVTFEFPSSVMRLETANKARIAVTNGGSVKVRVGLALALFDEGGNLVAAGAGGNKGGQVAPGEKAEFSVFFYYVSEQIPSAKTFQITMEVR